MSKLYIDITKDPFMSKSDSPARRSAQSAMYRIIINALDRIIAPMLAFTAEEIWQAMPHSSRQ